MVELPEDPALATKTQSWGTHLPAALFFVLLVLAVNYPLVFNLNTHVIGRSFEDAFEVLWQLSAVEKAVFQTRTNPFFTPDVFYPHGWYTASGAQPPWFLLLLSPLTAVAGPLITYNLALLATFIVGGFGVYWLVHRLTSRRVAGLLAGCAYIAAPVLAVRLGGHLHVLISAMFLPYAVDAVRVAMVQPPRARRAIAWAGVLWGLTILGHWYFLFIATLPILGFALAVASPLGWRARLGRLLAVGGITLVVLAPFALLAWQAREAMALTGDGAYSLANSARQGFSPDYLLSPNPLHPLWRERLSDTFPAGGEWDIVAVGYAAAALALLGLFVAPRSLSRPFAVMGLISFVLGLGPALRWRGRLVMVNAPEWLSRPLAGLAPELSLVAGQAAVLLPGWLLYRWLPLYSSVRVWARFSIPLMLAVAVLAGMGAAWLLSRGRAGRLLVIVLGALVVFEGLIVPYDHLTPVAMNERAADEWLAAQPPGTVLIEYPRPWVDKLAMYAQSRHGLRVVNGYMSFQPSFLAAVDEELGEWPGETAMPLLREWGIDFVVLSGSPALPSFAGEILPPVMAIDGLCLVETFPDAFGFPGLEQTYIFALLPEGEPCPP